MKLYSDEFIVVNENDIKSVINHMSSVLNIVDKIKEFNIKITTNNLSSTTIVKNVITEDNSYYSYVLTNKSGGIRVVPKIDYIGLNDSVFVELGKTYFGIKIRIEFNWILS